MDPGMPPLVVLEVQEKQAGMMLDLAALALAATLKRDVHRLRVVRAAGGSKAAAVTATAVARRALAGAAAAAVDLAERGDLLPLSLLCSLKARHLV